MRQFSIISLDNANTNFQCRAYDRFCLEKGFKGNKHMHSHTEIFFVTEGKGYFYIKNKKVPIHRGMVIINNANIQHAESAHPDCELAYAVLSVDNLAIQPPQSDDTQQTFFLDFSKEYDLMYDYIVKLEWEWGVREQFWQCALHTYFNSYIIHILRSSNLLGVRVPNSSGPNPMAGLHIHLSAYYADDITLDKLADIFCMNKYYMAHTYKKIYGESIMHSLKRIRCETARQQLQNTNYTIGQISAAVGYNSCSHFSKIYRSFYNETPTQTRQNFISENK